MFMPSTPLEEIQRRIELLQSAMADNGLDAALIVQKADLFYYSGTCQDAFLFVPVSGTPALMVRKSFERAFQDSPLEAVLSIRKLSDVRKHVLARAPRAPETLGMELDILPVNNFRIFQNLFPKTQINDVSPLIRTLRMVKSGHELTFFQEAARLNDEMFAYAGEVLREGMTELEFSGLLEAFHRKKGHQGFVRVRAFNQEVFYGHVMSGENLARPSGSIGPTGGAGPNASFPQGAGHRTIRRHEPIQIDHASVSGGYVVDQARTFYVGEPPAEFVKIHKVALAIQEAVVSEARVGSRCESLYDIAVRMAEEAELEEGFMGYPHPVSFVGHGVGLELDELPVLGRGSPHELQEGMVIAVEPKFIIPEKGLAGIENSFVVTRGGLQRLTLFDDEIQVVD